ncbi:MAG: hypothetical protein WD048_06035 [Chitinophagales bacterium]
MLRSLIFGFLIFSAMLLTAKDPSVMIIPFNPDMYFSDSDQELAKYNSKSIPEVRKMFRYGLSINMNARIMQEYSSRSMISDSAKDAQKDLAGIYNSIGYFEDKAKSVQVKEEMESNEKGLVEKTKGLFSRKKGEQESQESKQDNNIGDDYKKFINVKIKNPDLLPYLSDKYGTDVFVFINQFNLKTNYEHCLDRATNTFEREVLVHFSIFDKEGNQLAGDVATVYFPSNSNDLMDIMRNNFPPISDFLAANLPQKDDGVMAKDYMEVK